MSTQRTTMYLNTNNAYAFSLTGKETYGFCHSLTSSPLLHMDSLRELARYMQDQRSSYHMECSDSAADSGWSTQSTSTTLVDAIDGMAASNTLVLLKSVHRHPDYDRLLSDFLQELGDRLGANMSRQFVKPLCTIILASPKRITPYHMDDAHNFLMQVHGKKTFYVFDGSDRDIVSDQERDEFWSGNQSAAVLTEAKQRKAITYNLAEGDGVHVPMTYPHWAQNGHDISVAVSINPFRPPHNRLAEVYRMNNLLRRRGLHPNAPGTYPYVDGLKVAAFRALSAMKRIKDQTRRSPR